MVILSGIWRHWWCLSRAGWWPRGTGTSPTGWLIPMGRWWRPLRPTSGTCWRREGQHLPSGPMGWTCCAGSGSFGPVPESPGIGRHVSRPGISAGGCWSLASSHGRTGARRLRRRPLRLVRVKRTRRRSVRIRRRCCGRFTTFTAMRAPGRSSTRSRWTGPGVAGGRTRTTIRWSHSAASAAGSTGRGCPPGSRAVSPTGSSTRSSPGCRRTVTGHWSPFTCPPGRGPRSCCRPRWRGWTRGGR